MICVSIVAALLLITTIIMRIPSRGRRSESKKICWPRMIDWLMETVNCVMFHWTSTSPQRDGSRKPYEEAVNDFDVEKWARPEFLENAAIAVMKEEWEKRSWSKLDKGGSLDANSVRLG